MNPNKKQGLNKTPKFVKNGMNDIRNVEHITAKEKLKLRCKCQHCDESGKAVLFRSENKKSEYTGNPLFCCRICGAYLDIGSISEEELAASIDTFLRASNIIKLRLRPNQSEEDEKTYKTVWKFMYFLGSNKFAELFKAACRRNKNNRRNNSNGDGFISGAPRSSGK